MGDISANTPTKKSFTPLRVTYCSATLARAVYGAKIRMKKLHISQISADLLNAAGPFKQIKPTYININEYLPLALHILKIRDVAKAKAMKNFKKFIRHGCFYVRTKKDDTLTSIYNDDDLTTFLEKTPSMLSEATRPPASITAAENNFALLLLSGVFLQLFCLQALCCRFLHAHFASIEQLAYLLFASTKSVARHRFVSAVYQCAPVFRTCGSAPEHSATSVLQLATRTTSRISRVVSRFPAARPLSTAWTSPSCSCRASRSRPLSLALSSLALPLARRPRPP